MTQSPFERLGGKKGISKIVDNTVQLHMNNLAINPRFLPLKDKPELLATIKQHTVDFFIAGSGSPVEYKEKDMVSAHTGMNIYSTEYMQVMDDIFAALDKNGIDETTKKKTYWLFYGL